MKNPAGYSLHVVSLIVSALVLPVARLTGPYSRASCAGQLVACCQAAAHRFSSLAQVTDFQKIRNLFNYIQSEIQILATMGRADTNP